MAYLYNKWQRRNFRAFKCPLLALAFAATSVGVASADSLVRPRIREVKSPNEEFRAVSTPAADYGRTAATYSVYNMKRGAREPLWSISGSHFSDSYLSDDGQFVAVIGSWPSGSKPSASDRAIAFYERDKLLRDHRIERTVKSRGDAPRFGSLHRRGGSTWTIGS